MGPPWVHGCRRLWRAITLAIVKVLPEPVTPALVGDRARVTFRGEDLGAVHWVNVVLDRSERPSASKSPQGAADTVPQIATVSAAIRTRQYGRILA